MPGEPLRAPGFYGKVPARGDFVSRRVPRAFLDPWDSWLQRAVAASRAALGETWLDAYLTGPIWRFALGPGLCGERAAAGLVMPSVDSVGRYYPMTLAALLDGRPNPFALAVQGEAWFGAAEELALTCLEESFDPEAFDEALIELDEVGLDDFELPEAAGVPIVREDELSWAKAQPDTAAFPAAAYPDLLDSFVSARREPYSLWWTLGSDRVPPGLRSYPGLPPEESFAGFLRAA